VEGCFATGIYSSRGMGVVKRSGLGFGAFARDAHF